MIDDCPTWKLFISLHPSDGGRRLAAHGGAGHLRLVAFSQDLIPGLDDGVTWRNWGRTNKRCELQDEETPGLLLSPLMELALDTKIR